MEESNLLKKIDVKYIIIHCSDTSNHDTAIDIHKLHISFGWDGIGYHKIILRNGKLKMEDLNFEGAHAYKYNDKALVCNGKIITLNNKIPKSFNCWKNKYPYLK